MKNRKKNGFEKREEVAQFGYWEDPRWEKVNKLRNNNRDVEANSLVFKIRNDWGVE